MFKKGGAGGEGSAEAVPDLGAVHPFDEPPAQPLRAHASSSGPQKGKGGQSPSLPRSPASPAPLRQTGDFYAAASSTSSWLEAHAGAQPVASS